MSAEIEKKISDQLYETLETVFGYLELGMIEKADAENLFAGVHSALLVEQFSEEEWEDRAKSLVDRCHWNKQYAK